MLYLILLNAVIYYHFPGLIVLGVLLFGQRFGERIS